MKADIIIIGAGIVGLATAYSILKTRPGTRLVILEKENAIGRHQTGHNSGVIHSGLYYPPGSFKATNCIAGYTKLLAFCDEHDLPYEICGKIVVATDQEQVPLLENLHLRGKQNGLQGLKPIVAEELTDYEPYVTGLKGLWVPQTGIIDYVQVAQKLAGLIEAMGGVIKLEHNVVNIQQQRTAIATAYLSAGPMPKDSAKKDRKTASIRVFTEQEVLDTRIVVGCAGLHSDRVARFTKPDLDLRIIPFRGEYYELKPDKHYLVKNLIYPVPDPSFPFLGVHFTRMINGGVEAGPNAVLAFAKEGYKKSDINLKELYNSLSWPGFQKIAYRYWDKGLGEMYRSFSKAAFTRALQKLIPDIRQEDLVTGGAGVRAQASSRDGGLLDDFYIVENHTGIYVCNAPSPAATSSLSIGETISKKVFERLE